MALALGSPHPRKFTATDNKIVIQYWFFYLYNDHIFDHEGDWEMIQIICDENENPQKAGYSQHYDGETKSWTSTPKEDGHPKVYVAKGGHGSFYTENKNTITDPRGDYDKDHSDGCDAVDDEATNLALFSAIDHIGEYVTLNDFMILTMRGHGSKESDGAIRLISESMMPDDRDDLYFNILNDKIENKIKNYNRMAILIGSCYSGHAIPELERENRIVMTSSEAKKESYCTLGTKETGAFFYKGMHRGWGDKDYPGVVKSLGDISTPFSLGYAFDKGYTACQMNYSGSTKLGIIATDCRSIPQISNKTLANVTYL